MLIGLMLCGAINLSQTSVSPDSHILAQPDVHGDELAFACEGDIWIGSIKNQTAYRLTTDPGDEANPRLSPDGKMVAFTAGYDGGRDVYVMSVDGGSPTRLTYDPTGAEAIGWTKDGQSVLFRSRRNGAMDGFKLFDVPVGGGLPQVYAIPEAAEGSISPSGNQIAYVRLAQENHWWKHYRGGEANGIWIADLAKNSFKRIDQSPYEEQFPAWAKSGLYYISSLTGSANLWSYDPKSGKNRQLTFHDGLDARFASTDGDTVVYQLGSDIWQYNPQTGADKKVELHVVTDRLHARPIAVPFKLEGYSLGPTGKRLVVESRGRLFNAPSTEGAVVPLDTPSGFSASDASWSPDGKLIAYVSDHDGEENIWVTDPDGDEPPKQLTHRVAQPIVESIGGAAHPLVWSSDSQFIVFADSYARLWKVDVVTGKSTQLASCEWGDFQGYDISADSKWVAYAQQTSSYVSSIFLCDLATGKSTKVEGSPFRDHTPAFDPTGKYLYFLSERSVVPKADGFDFNFDYTDTTKVCLVCLDSSTPSPFSPKNDSEADSDGDEEQPPAKPKTPTTPSSSVDVVGLANRVVQTPADAGTISDIQPFDGGFLYQDDSDLKSFSLEDSKTVTLASEIVGFQETNDSKKVAIQRAGSLQIAELGPPIAPGTGLVPLNEVVVEVDPSKEWAEILRQAWRNQRDLFYDPKTDGQDMNAIYKRYSALLPSVGSRGELNQVLGQMIAEMNVSHEFAGGGFTREPVLARQTIASLGLDLDWDAKAGQYVVKHILQSDGFDAENASPVARPGVGLSEGDILVSIAGHPLDGKTDPNKWLIGKGGKVIDIEFSNPKTPTKSKKSLVVPLASDRQLRYYDWVASQRHYVEEHGGPKIGYIHIQDMEQAGSVEISKWLYANSDKEGLIIDVRDNPGGNIDSQVLDRLRRIIFEYDQGRYGQPSPNHPFGITAHLVAMCNENSASDAEYFCQGFKYENLGPTVGTRTWGGFMAVGSFQVVDGGYVTTPIMGSFSPDGKWLPDGIGFTPDYQVSEDPGPNSAGADPQLDKAISLLKEAIAKEPRTRPGRQIPPSQAKAFPWNRMKAPSAH